VLLLDTHALLWWLADDDRLPTTARKAIRNEAVVNVSAGTVWEIALKRALGKLDIADGWYQAAFRDFTELPITAEHARRAGELPPHHRDPFDRMLIAQALVDGLTLVTADPAFEPYAVSRAW
jgi:PIN domain nuclease of toxin-antitoxin system